MTCPGSGSVSSHGFSLGDVLATSNATGKPSRARASCRFCNQKMASRVVYSRHGRPYPEGAAILPKHEMGTPVVVLRGGD